MTIEGYRLLEVEHGHGATLEPRLGLGDEGHRLHRRLRLDVASSPAPAAGSWTRARAGAAWPRRGTGFLASEQRPRRCRRCGPSRRRGPGRRGNPTEPATGARGARRPRARASGRPFSSFFALSSFSSPFPSSVLPFPLPVPHQAASCCGGTKGTRTLSTAAQQASWVWLAMRSSCRASRHALRKRRPPAAPAGEARASATAAEAAASGRRRRGRCRRGRGAEKEKGAGAAAEEEEAGFGF